MKRFLPVSIRGQLFLMALIIAVPAAGIIVYSGLDQRRQAIHQAETQTQKLADTIVSEQNNLVAAAQQLLVALAQLPEVRDHDAERVQPVLRDIQRLNPFYANITISDRNGIVWGSAVPIPSPTSVADRRYFRNARASGRFSSGEYIYGRIFNKPAINFGYPFRDRAGNFAGVIAVNFDLAAFSNLFQLSKLPTNSSYLLVDQSGVILGRAYNAQSFIGKRDKAALFRKMQEDERGGTFVAEASDGLRRLITYRRLYLKGEQTPYMYVRASIPVKEAIGEANSSLFVNLTLLTSFLALGCVCSWIVGKHSIIERISVLHAVAKRLAEGDLQARAEGVSGGELGDLGLALNEMACRLEQDQVARKRAEEAQKKTERFLLAIIDTEPDCVKLLAPDYTVQMMNRAGLEMIEMDSPDQLIGHPAYEFVAPEYRSRFIAATEAVMKGAEGSFEFEAVGSKGRRLWLQTHAVPFRDEQGVITSILGITRDVTQQKLAETALADQQKELEELNRTLEQRVEESVAELRRKDQMLINQNRMAGMGEMLNNIAHQWRQPLNNVGLIIQNLLCNYQLGLLTAEEMETHVEKAMETIQFMSRTIDDFRSFSLPEKEECRFIINDVVQSTVDLVSPTLKYYDIDVRFQATEQVAALGYPNQYSQVILNIINNARDVLVERNVTDPRITITASRDGNHAVIRVHDNGGGIDEAILGRIFDPFFTSKDSGKGTGIGLYMSKVIIEQNMSGTVSATNMDGGAAFMVTLPAVGESLEGSTA